MKQVLVTGATGFGGRHLCSYLLRSGYQVSGTHLPSEKPEAIEGVRLYPLDISDSKETGALVRRLNPEGIFHLAAVSIPSHSWRDPGKTFAVNVAGTIHLLEAIRKYRPDARILFVSSTHAYGRLFCQKESVQEKDLLWPESPYAVSKAVAEYACLDYYQRFKIRVIIARPFNHLGVGLSEALVISNWCKQVALIEKGIQDPFLEVGNLKVKRNFLHALDVIRAYEILMRQGESGQVYNIGADKPVVLEQFAGQLLKLARVAIKIKVQKSRMRLNDPPVTNCDSSRLRALGWRPEHSAAEATEELLNYWRMRVGSDE